MKIAICALTFKRPDGLAALLDSYAGLRFEKNATPELVFVVVDNDPAGSAQALCTSKAAAHGFQLIYTIEPEQGIPLARNTGMRTAPQDCDYIVWVDDDECVTPLWLDELLACALETGAEVVNGPVRALYGPSTEPWLIEGGFFDRKPRPDRALQEESATNNVMISVAAWRASGLWFDLRLRYTGSSDTLFFMTGRMKHGWRIVRAAAAEVTEIQPPSRLTENWILKRQFRVGGGLTLCDVLLNGKRNALPRRLVKAGANVALGALIFLRGLATGKIDRVTGKARIARGLGMASALFGKHYAEYAPDKLCVKHN